MKGKLSFMWRATLALVLVLSLGVVMAAPVSASEETFEVVADGSPYNLVNARITKTDKADSVEFKVEILDEPPWGGHIHTGATVFISTDINTVDFQVMYFNFLNAGIPSVTEFGWYYREFPWTSIFDGVPFSPLAESGTGITATGDGVAGDRVLTVDIPIDLLGGPGATYYYAIGFSTNVEGAYPQAIRYSVEQAATNFAVAYTPPSEVWVDDDWTNQADVDVFDDTLTWDVDAFDTIQEGVNLVAEAGTVNVAAGEYEENVVIDVEGLTLESTVKHGANIKGYIWIQEGADGVSVTGFKLTDLTEQILGEYHFIGVFADGALIEGNLIDGLGVNDPPSVCVNGIMLNTYGGSLLSADVIDNDIVNVHMGIYAQGETNLDAAINRIEGATHCAIGIDNTVSDAGTELSGNIITGCSLGLELMGGAVLVTGNEISGSRVIGTGYPNEGAGIWLTGDIAGTEIGSEGVEADANTITGSGTYDIHVCSATGPADIWEDNVYDTILIENSDLVYVHVLPGEPAEATVTGDGSVEALDADTTVEYSGAEECTITTEQLEEAEVGEATFGAAGKYVDVKVDNPENVEELMILVYYTEDDIVGLVEDNLIMYWYDGIDWRACSDTGVDTGENYIWARIDDETSPTLAQMTGTPFGPGGGLSLDKEYYEPGDTVIVTVGDADANIHFAHIDTVEVKAKNDLGDEVEEIVLEETGVNTGVFTGSFRTTDQWPAPAGQLYVEDYEQFDAEGVYIPDSMVNDIITVTYSEEGEDDLTVQAAVNNDWPEVTLVLPDELVNNDPVAVEASSSTTNPEYGLDYDLVIFVVTIDAPQALVPDNVVLSAELGGVEVVAGNLVGFWGTEGGFPMLTHDETSTFDAKIVDGPLGIYTVTVDLLDLTFPEEGGVTYEGNEYHVLASVSDTTEVVAAEPLMVSVDPKEVSVKDVTTSIEVTFQGSDFLGPGNAESELDTVKVTLSGPGVDLTEDNFNGLEITGDDATGFGADSLTFSVTPEQAGTITVTVAGTFDVVPPATKPVVITKTLTIDVTGFVVEETWADVGLGTTGAISLRVTTEAGVAVNTGIVIITAAEDAGFEKNVDPLEESDESFKVIVIDGSKITYKDASGDPVGDQEDFLVEDGNYEVTGITFANIGDVEVLVTDAGANAKAHFLTAFSVLGIDIYDLSFAPATLTAGVDATGLKITITENGDPVTDVDKIFIGGVEKTSTRVDNVYTITTELLYLEAKTGEDALDVMARNEAGTEYGTATLEVELPVVIPDTEIMLTGVEYTVTVSVIDALGEALKGNLWIGTYDEEEEEFTANLGVHPADAPIVLEADGTGEFDITVMAKASLVWKVGSGDGVDDAALVLEPSIAVEVYSLTLAWAPEAPIVDDEVTFTVTDNYGEGIGDIEITIVTPGGIPIDRVTTPEGVFKYTATEAGNYYVSVGTQDPVTVPVLLKRLESITASPSEVTFIVGGEPQELIIIATYSDGVQPDVTAFATYLSSDEDVVTVDAGVVTAVGEGEATIRVTYIEGVITKTAEVSVTVSVWNALVAYDDDENGVIDKTEAVAAVWDYFNKTITKAQALEVLWLYFE